MSKQYNALEILKNRDRYLKNRNCELIRDERNLYGIYYLRHQAYVLTCSIWFRKKKGEQLVKTEFIPTGLYGTKYAYIDSPRYLQIDKCEMKTRWRADELRQDCLKMSKNGVIFINKNQYLESALMNVPNIEMSGLWSFDEELYEMTETTQDLIKSNHIVPECSFNWGDDMQKSALLMIASKLCNYLVADNYVVGNWLELNNDWGIR